MKNYLINSKKITLEKNKEFIFKIPVLFKPADCEFHIETIDNVNFEKPVVYFYLKSLKSNDAMQVPLQLDSVYTKENLFHINNQLTEEYLLMACLSDQLCQFSLSIIRSKS